MTLAEYEALDDDARVELFDAEASRVWRVAEPAKAPHEKPLARLAEFMKQVAMVRGSPILLGRAAGLELLDADRRQVRAMHPDEMVFLDPEREGRIGSTYAWGSDQEHPDVVVEVDDTTDVRRNKLLVYADWGFPEVWVEVPEAYSPSRSPGRQPGLTIYLLESGAYRESEESRAFPGLRAEEMHRVLNERAESPETVALALRVGRALGGPEGTGPEDNPLLRQQRAEARAAERATANAATARTLLRGRGCAVSAAFPDDLPTADRRTLARASPAAVAAAVLSANSLADFLHRLRASEDS
jgi:Uma2 family endonuclease